LPIITNVFLLHETVLNTITYKYFEAFSNYPRIVVVNITKRFFSMNFQDLVPHLIASLSLIEAQVNEWDKEQIDNSLLPSERDELKSVRSIVLEMRKTINLFQLAIAKGHSFESERQIKIFYGLLWMCRPSIQKTHDILSNSNIKNYSSRISSLNLEHALNKENAH
jgi:hypothetical protein